MSACAALASVVRADPPPMSAEASLGKSLFFDRSLSNPVGQSCASCHEPGTGFTFPDSRVNATLGVAQGVVPGRFMARAVPQVSYSAFNPVGPPFFDPVIELYVGGQFWDGRAATLEEQARAPFLNPNEMNNLTQNVPDPAMVVQKVATGPSAARFREVFGAGVFGQPTEVVFGYVAQAIAAYERSSEVSPFSSKYDAWRAGRATLSASELNGLRLATGSWTGRPDGAAFPRFAHCVDCHMVPTVPSGGRDLWTNTCYQNIGVPRNPRNPFYSQTDPVSNPVGYNPQGAAFLDYGLGTTFYTRMGLPPGNVGPGSNGQGDFLGVNGQFKAPSLRNVDLRTRPGFVKAYMHNGVFTSLEQVVHFYNTRNLTTHPGEVIDFTRANPYAGLRGRPLWDTPEYASAETLVNAVGALGTDPGTGQGGESGAQVGNLGITGQEERDIVAFLRTLSDGYFDPDTHGACVVITSQPVSQQACPGSSASFTVASSVPKALGYQWRRNGVPIAGADTSYYWIVSATLVDAGEYDCIVKAECGSVTSRAATLSVCAADFNCDGRVDAGDFTAFLAAYHAHDPAADLNGDGVVDVRDFVAFQHAMQTGC